MSITLAQGPTLTVDERDEHAGAVFAQQCREISVIIADMVIERAKSMGSLVCPSPCSVIPPCMHLPAVCAERTHIHMRTRTTVTNSSQVDGRHSQKDINSLTSTCGFILYLPPALLTLFSRAKTLSFGSRLTEC